MLRFVDPNRFVLIDAVRMNQGQLQIID